MGGENMGTIDRKEIAPLAGEAKARALVEIRNKFRGESRADQATRLREALRVYPVSTFEARRYLDIMHPAGRVQELRESGNQIDTLRVSEESDVGRPHRIAVYVLRNESRA
jgi:hypothetical protein